MLWNLEEFSVRSELSQCFVSELLTFFLFFNRLIKNIARIG